MPPTGAVMQHIDRLVLRLRSGAVAECPLWGMNFRYLPAAGRPRAPGWPPFPENPCKVVTLGDRH